MNLIELWEQVSNRLKNGARLKDCMDLLGKYNSTTPHDDYLDFVRFNPVKYNRGVVFRTDEAELVVMSWSPNQQSGFHSHPGECIFRVLQGYILEDLLIPRNKDTENKYYTANRSNRLTVFKPNDVGYIDNERGIHNMYSDEGAVSIHFYSPPFSMK